jgi:hypothetical protein
MRVGSHTTTVPGARSRSRWLLAASYAALTVLAVNVFAFVLVLSFSNRPVHAGLELPVRCF